MASQRVVLFQSEVKAEGMFATKRVDNLPEINALLEEGWRVVTISPTSSASPDIGSQARVFALVVLERE